MKYTLFMLAALPFTLLTPVAMADDAALATVKPVAAEFDKRVNAHDAKGVADLFTTKAVLIPAPAPGGTAFLDFFDILNHYTK